MAYLDVLYALNGEVLPGKSGWLAGARRLTAAPLGWEEDLTKLTLADLALVPSLWERLAQGLYDPVVNPVPAKEISLNARDVLIHTDGGCIGNPGPGAWAFLIRSGGERWEGSGGEDLTTNNKMELTAVIKSLEAVGELPNRPQRIEIRTDSQYVKNGITTWIRSWLANGWKTASKGPVKNQDLWERLHLLNQEFHPHWTWVKGHAGNEDNEACDQLVQKTIRQRSSSVKRP
ncbi:MAG: ribonuclease HI [Spirochaetales bacterium]|nr:ribonuclease HI [Spirochaetales bacterium]